VKRLIQKELVNELSKEIINGTIIKEDKITISVKEDKICFVNETRSA
jgi:ATP-dependent Clp protease ATP-binding subunit ClpA